MMIARGVEISMARGGEVIVRAYPSVSFLFFSFFFNSYIHC